MKKSLYPSKRIIIAIILLVCLICFLSILSNNGKEAYFNATIVSLEGDTIVANVNNQSLSGFGILPKTVTFDCKYLGDQNLILKPGDDILVTYIKGSKRGNTLRVVSVILDEHN